MRLRALFGFGRAERLIHTVDEAIAALAEALPGFAAFDAAIADDGRAALAIDPTGRIALLVVQGTRVRAREVEWPMLRLTGAGVLVEARGRFAGVLLTRLSAIDMRRLGMPPLPQREPAEIVGEPEAA